MLLQDPKHPRSALDLAEVLGMIAEFRINLHATYDLDQATKRRKNSLREFGWCKMQDQTANILTLDASPSLKQFRYFGLSVLKPRAWQADRAHKASLATNPHRGSFFGWLVMKIQLPIEGFEGRQITLICRSIGRPKIQVDGESLRGHKGTFAISNHAGREVTIRIKKRWLDPLPLVEIDNVPFSLRPSLCWYDQIFIALPLALAIPAGLLGGMVGLICAVLNLRVFRTQQAASVRYGLSACLSVMIAGIFLFYWITNSSAFVLDAALQQEIEGFIDGMEVSWRENNILHAMQLDQQGREFLYQGKDKEAYDINRKVLAISYQQGSLQGIMNSLGGLSYVFQRMGNEEDAIKAAQVAYKIGRLLNDRFEYGLVELRLASLQGKANRRLGIMWRMRAKESLKGTPYQHDYIGLLSELAGELQWLGLKEDATKIYEEAYTLAQHIGQSPDQKLSKWDVALDYGRILKQQGACEKAVSVFEQALPTFTADDRHSPYYSYLLKDLADCYVTLGRQDLAAATFLQAYASYESQRRRMLGDHARAKLDDEHGGLVDAYINYLLTIGKPTAALALLETNKARTLSDIRDDGDQKSVYARLIAQERAQADQIQILMERWKEDHDNGIENEDRWNEYLRLARELNEDRRKLHRQLQIRTVPVSAAVTEQDIEALQAQVGQDTAVLAYFVSEERIGIFLVTEKGMHYIPTTLSYTEYRHAIEQLRLALSNEYTEYYRAPARLLYDHLFRPVRQELSRTVKHVIYSPDHTLFYIPLGVLHDGTTFLAEQYALTRLPTLRFFNLEKHLTTTRLERGISCTDPAINGRRLPFQQETNHVLKMLYKQRVTSLVGTSCSPQRLEESVNATAENAFLHIGAHGTFYEPDPMQSGIVLSSEKSDASSSFWNARAMASMNLRHIKLVTLSSCETGLKDYDRLRDVFGIMRGLFFGGAHQVLAPLWSVQDRATAQLIQTFYKAVAKNGRADVSLQQAQQAMIHHGKFQHPFYWSGFVLTGGPT